jgi:hypothetical protein
MSIAVQSTASASQRERPVEVGEGTVSVICYASRSGDTRSVAPDETVTDDLRTDYLFQD